MPVRHIFLLILSSLFGSSMILLGETHEQEKKASTFIGMEGCVLVDIPKPEVFAKRQSQDSNLLLHISPISSSKISPNTISYKINYTGYLPGNYNLANYLVRMEPPSAPTPVKHTIPVTITSALPKKHNGILIPPASRPYDFFTSYNILLTAVCCTWLLLLIFLILRGRKPSDKTSEVIKTPPPNIEEILRPLFDKAQNHQLNNVSKATLEKAVLLKLQSHLHLEEGASPYEIIQALQENKKTAPVIEILNTWLHKKHPSPTLSKLTSKNHKLLLTATLPETSSDPATKAHHQ